MDIKVGPDVSSLQKLVVELQRDANEKFAQRIGTWLGSDAVWEAYRKVNASPAVDPLHFAAWLKSVVERVGCRGGLLPGEE